MEFIVVAEKKEKVGTIITEEKTKIYTLYDEFEERKPVTIKITESQEALLFYLFESGLWNESVLFKEGLPPFEIDDLTKID
jgi:hypothetical protein